MPPPYRPDHVESVVKLQNQEMVQAVCSCGWRGSVAFRLGRDQCARALIADFNEHRETYT